MGKMIFFKNGVYTLIEHSLTDKEIEELSKDKSFVVSSTKSGSGLNTFSLYGGRVKIEREESLYGSSHQSIFLFLLTINMNAGLDNQAYIDAYAESENVISQHIENAE